MYRGNLQNTGVYDTRAARHFGEQPNWIFQAQSPITCSPVVADGLVYFGTRAGNLFAVDIRTGTERWRFSSGGPVVVPPELAGGIVYCVVPIWGLTTIDAQSGAEIPHSGSLADLRDPSPPAIAGQIMYISSDSGHHAVDISTGKIIRSFEVEGIGNRRPVVDDGIVVFGSSSWVEVIDVENGESRNRLDGDAQSLFTNDMCLNSHFVYLFTWQAYHLTDRHEDLPRSLTVLDTRNKYARCYLEKLPQDSLTSPAADNGIIYFGGDAGFHAIRILAETLRWEFTTGASIQSSPSIAEDLVYFGCNDGALYILNKDTGQLVKRLATASGEPIFTSPALWDGAVYFGDTGGTLYSWGSAVDTSGD